ncbi:hypothetical protein BH23CHL5_BH23CHL5_20410 [soil metagenome]
MTFENVISAGQTFITVEYSPPSLPAGYSLDGALFFDISTTALFEGSIEICLSYDPDAFENAAELALLHYDGDAWQDVTIFNDPISGEICGSVNSLSPFAIVQAAAPEPEPMVITGFYAPVDMGDGVVNTVKGGSTVPLKFEVHQDGVELTDTEAIASFTVTKISCSSQAHEEPVDFTTSGSTSLKYSGGMFHQNWKTPKSTGCYKVVVTTVDGATLVAYFRLK